MTTAAITSAKTKLNEMRNRRRFAKLVLAPATTVVVMHHPLVFGQHSAVLRTSQFAAAERQGHQYQSYLSARTPVTVESTRGSPLIVLNRAIAAPPESGLWLTTAGVDQRHSSMVASNSEGNRGSRPSFNIRRTKSRRKSVRSRLRVGYGYASKEPVNGRPRRSRTSSENSR